MQRTQRNFKVHNTATGQIIQRLAIAIFVTLAGGSAYGQFGLPVPETALLGVAASGDAAAVKELLRAGANPNEGRLAGLPAIMFPLMMQNREMFQAFLDAKADPNVRDKLGATTLMWAVYNPDPDEAVLQRLLNAGVDPNAQDSRGDTALVWAMRRGSTAAVRLLKEAGALREAQIREAVEKSLTLLQKSSPQFIGVSGCISCHHQVLPAMAIAREHGITFNEAESAKDIEAMVAVWRNAREYMTRDAHKIPNPPINASYSLVGLAAAKYPRDETTDAMARFIAPYQQADGSWHSEIRRPPMEASDITATALSLRSLQLCGDDARQVSRAAKWLASQEPHSNEDQVMQLLGLCWTHADPAIVERQAHRLLAKQQPGGGWSQLDTPESDAYATRQALVALYTSGIVQPTDAAYSRAVDYLLRTQLGDGSWLVVSRSFPIQPYEESGFPQGKDQWISAAGTSWASMALSLATSFLKVDAIQQVRRK